MKSKLANIHPSASPLLVICLLHFALWLLKGPHLAHSDDHWYLQEARNILSGGYTLQDNPKNHRLALILPAALCIKLFGESAFSLALFPLLVSLATLWLVYDFAKKKIGAPAALAAAGLLSLNILQIDFAGQLFPDVVLSFWIFLFFTSLLQWLENGNKKFLLVNLLAFVFGLFTKELMVMVLLFAAIKLILHASAQRTWKPILVYSATLASVIIAISALFWFLTGDTIFLYRSVENNHNAAFGNNFSGEQIVARLSTEPFKLINSYLGLLLTLVPALPLAFYAIRRPSRHPHTFNIALYLLSSLAFLWFGSTSFTRYVPVWLIERMWIPCLIPACILVATAYQVNDIRFFLFLTFLIIVLGIEQAVLFGPKRLTLFGLFTMCFAMISHPMLAWKYKIYLLLFPYLALAIYFAWTNSAWDLSLG